MKYVSTTYSKFQIHNVQNKILNLHLKIHPKKTEPRKFDQCYNQISKKIVLCDGYQMEKRVFYCILPFYRFNYT